MLLPGDTRQISTSKGWRFIRSVEAGSRPSLIEIFLSAHPNFPLGDAQISSGMSFVFILFMEMRPLGSGSFIVEMKCVQNPVEDGREHDRHGRQENYAAKESLLRREDFF